MSIKRIIIMLLMIVLCITPAVAGQFDCYTQDVEVKSALSVLDKAGAHEVFRNLDQNAVKIMFYDLSQVSFSYMNHFAINSVDSFGNRFILINTKYKNASPEEIACLIAHESFHKSKVATLEEETLATTKEAKYWSMLKNPEKVYRQSALLSRLDNLVALDNASDVGTEYIKAKISNSNFYRNQLAIR